MSRKKLYFPLAFVARIDYNMLNLNKGVVVMIINETNYFNPEYSGSCFVVHDDGTLEITTHHSNCKQSASKEGDVNMKKGYKYIFSEEARALALCVENEAVLYPRIKSIVKMLARKYAKGTYDHAKAPLAYLCVVVEMAKLYHKRYGTPGTKYYDMFNPQIRYSAACMVADSFFENVEQNDL